MADITVSTETGKTITASIFKDRVLISQGLAVPEIPNTGEYGASLPELERGKYLVVFFIEGQKVGSNTLFWDGNKEIAPNYINPPSPEAIAIEVEAAIINEDDGQAVIKAISDKILEESVTTVAIASAVRTELALELGRIDANVTSRSSLVVGDLNTANAPLLKTNDYVAPDNSTIGVINTKVQSLQNANTAPLATKVQINNLNDPSTSEIVTAMQLVKDDFKADLTEVAKTEDLEIINNGVKKSSLLIPHQTNLTNGFGLQTIIENTIFVSQHNDFKFDANYTVGTPTEPATGELILNLDNAIVGNAVFMHYNGASLPNFVTEWLNDTDDLFVENTTCYISFLLHKLDGINSVIKGVINK